MKWGMILLLVILGFGLTGSAQADEDDYWIQNMQVGQTTLPTFEIPCGPERTSTTVCERTQIIFEQHHDPFDQIGATILSIMTYDIWTDPAAATWGFDNIIGPEIVSMTTAPHPYMSRTTDSMRHDSEQSTPGVADGVKGDDWLAGNHAFGGIDPGIMPQNGGE